MRYAVVTFGCRVNQADSLRIEEDLLRRGAVESTGAAADLVVVNTCSVTATADQGARQTIRRISRDNPSARIVVTGCYATRAPADLLALPNVIRVVANTDKSRLVDTVLEAFPGLTTAERFAGAEGPCGAPIAPGLAGRTAFTLRVQTGCEERCAYCIIPTTRGAGRSLPIGAVIREVERVAASGFREVAITGVHLGSYGRDLDPVGVAARSAARPGCLPGGCRLPGELARADGLLARGGGADRCQRRPLRAALPSAAPARQQSAARAHAPAVHARRSIDDWSTESPTACRTPRSGPT